MQIHGWNWTGVKSRIANALVVIVIMAWVVLSLLAFTTFAYAQNPAVIIPGPIPTLTANCTIQRNGANTDWTCAAAAGASQPLTDSAGLIANAADATKVLAFQLSGLTTSTTRTWTIPDANITFPTTIASLGANTFTGLQTANGGIAATTGTFSSTLGVTGTLTGTTINATAAFQLNGSAQQNVASGQAPTFTGTNFTGIPAAGVSSGTFAGSTAAVFGGTLAWGGGSAISSSSNVALLNAANNYSTAQVVSGAPASVTDANGAYVGYDSGVGYARFGVKASGGNNRGVYIQTLSAGSVVDAIALSPAGLLTVSGLGTHSFSAGGTGFNRFDVRNTAAGTGNGAQLNVGNDADAQLGQLVTLSSTYTSAGDLLANGYAVRGNGAGGMSLSATHASGDVRIYSRNALAATFGASQALRLHGYGAGTLVTDASGNVTASSDERLKDITGQFTPGLNALMGIAPIRYRYKSSTGLDTENVYAGFSAQNVRDYVPEAVGKSLDGMYSLNIVPVVAATVTAVQELTREVDELRATLKLPAKSRTQAKADDTRVVNSVTKARLAEVAKADADKVASEKAKAAQAVRDALVACQADNAIIVQQGGKPLVCVVTTEQKAIAAELVKERAAAEAAAAAEAKKQQRDALATCEALNVKIKAQGGTPVACTTGEVR
jgi:hypothetical protein